MLQQQPSNSNQYSSSNKQQLDDGAKWNWRENRMMASNGLFRCKSACETNTVSNNMKMKLQLNQEQDVYLER